MEKKEKKEEFLNSLIEVFKKRYGYRTIKIKGNFCGDSGLIKALRINKETNKLEYDWDWYCFGWQEYDKFEDQKWAVFHHLIKILGVTTATRTRYHFKGKIVFEETMIN